MEPLLETKINTVKRDSNHKLYKQLSVKNKDKSKTPQIARRQHTKLRISKEHENQYFGK